MTRRILVTRPQPGADATAQRLTRMGFSPVLLPLTRIEPLAQGPLPEPVPVDAVAITSVNAIRRAPAALLAGLREKPLFAVGDASASAAREAGFADVRSAAGTARELAAAIVRDTAPGARILHLAGVERIAGFAEGLHETGRPVSVVEIYRATEVSYSTDFLQQVAEGGAFHGALVLSPRAGALLTGLAAHAPMREALEKTTFFCISDNAAMPLRTIARARVVVSAEPAEDSVLLALSSQA